MPNWNVVHSLKKTPGGGFILQWGWTINNLLYDLFIYINEATLSFMLGHLLVLSACRPPLWNAATGPRSWPPTLSLSEANAAADILTWPRTAPDFTLTMQLIHHNIDRTRCVCERRRGRRKAHSLDRDHGPWIVHILWTFCSACCPLNFGGYDFVDKWNLFALLIK